MDDLIDVYAVLEQIETIATLCTDCEKTEKDADDVLYAIKTLANVGLTKFQSAEASKAEPNTATG